MPIDEFGREIPAAGASSGHPTPFADPLRDDNNNNNIDHRNRSGGGGHHRGSNPLLDGGELSARRDDHRGVGGGRGGGGRSRSPGAGVGVGGGGGGGRGASPSPDGGGGRNRREYDGGHHGDRRGGHGRGRHRSRSRADSGYDDRGGGGRRSSGGGGGRRHRSRSYGDNDDRDDYHHHGGGRHHHGSGGGGGRSHHRSTSSSHQSRSKAHASERYTEQPMLCQFLWKKEMEEEKRAKANNNKPEGEGEKNEEEKAIKDVEMDDGETNHDNAEANPQEDQEEKQPKPPPLFESEQAESSAYAEYNGKYCLNYIRTFFNHHLDDPWFRTRLSPLEAYRQAQKERGRANTEANEMKKEILSSLEDMTKGVIPKKDPDCAEYLGPPKCNFVASCRLGVGTKPTNPTAAHNYHHHHIMHHHHHQRNYYEQENEMDMQHNVLQGEDRNRIERHAKSHLHSFIRTESCVKIMDVPPNVSDDQLLATLAEYCAASITGREEEKGAASSTTRAEPPTAVWSDAVSIPVHDNSSMDPYHRTAYAVFSSSAAKDRMLENLHKANEDANRRSSRDGGRRSKSDAALPRVLDLDVDCTDVYGRREVDADGRGGAPPSSGSGKKKDSENTKFPTKRCTVYVSTSLLSSSQPVSVLSAALSSRARIIQDKEDVTTITGILDEVREIEAGRRLADLLRLLYPDRDEFMLADDEDILDISIAYLRRVHLFSFYNGCTSAKNVGNVLSFMHSAGTIHLRLRDADEILAKNAEESKAHDIMYGATNGGMAEEDKGGAEDGDGTTTEGATPKNAGKDMLVTRLNDSISKALEKVKELSQQGPSCLVDAETDAAALKIQTEEQSTRQEWIENHGILDEDGRARCSFHYCKKLFKDKAFLHKHLLKKHSDQLRAECAKCHDGPMMAAWDSDERRPVPPVLIDCGSKFGLVPSPVTGHDQPSAHDPEPELWREEQERIAEEERIRREREAAARAAEEEMQRRREAANAGEKRKSNFVDPDDMVEEKVELKFEEVVVAPPPKKKKKKKKSLL